MDGHKSRREDGFSLLEVLIALTILAVGLLSLALFQVTAIKGNASASRTTVATQLAQEQMETYRRTAWASITSSGSGFTDNSTVPDYTVLPGGAGDNVALGGTRYYRIVRVQANGTGSMKTITVWSCWQDDRGLWHNVTLITNRTNVGT